MNTEVIFNKIDALKEYVRDTISACELREKAANDRICAIQDGLHALLYSISGEKLTKPVSAVAGKSSVTNKLAAVSQPSRNDLAPYYEALSTSWSTVHQIHEAVSRSGIKAVEGTVYNRMRTMMKVMPERVEHAESPKRWRLRAPANAALDVEPSVKTRRQPRRSVAASTSVSTRTSNGVEEHNAPTHLPSNAITDVRQRVLNQPMPKLTFKPDLRRGDCFELMAAIPSGSVDLILADPPYGICRGPLDPKIDIDALWKEYWRILSPLGWIVLFGSQPFTQKLITPSIEQFKYQYVWIKNSHSGGQAARNRPMKQHEDIVCFTRGTTIQRERSLRRATYNPIGMVEEGMEILRQRSCSYLNMKHKTGKRYRKGSGYPRSLLYCSKDKGERFHVYQKPVHLLDFLIRTFSNEGDMVLDSFAGSGSTCIAAFRTGRKSMGIEQDHGTFATAQRRLTESLRLMDEPSRERAGNDNVAVPNQSTAPDAL